MDETSTVWLQYWQRPRVHRRFDLRTGRCLESKLEKTDKPLTPHFGVCSRCSLGFALVYRTSGAIWLQLGITCFRMDQRKVFFSHERRLGGILSELRIEPRDGSSPALVVRDISIGRALFDEEDFLLWVANSANDITWVSWISQRWQAVDAGGAANASTA